MYLDNFLDKATNELIHINSQVSILSHIVGRIVEELTQANRLHVDSSFNYIIAEDCVMWVYEFLDEYEDCLLWGYDTLVTQLKGYIELRIFEANYMDE
jgi:hypothetical protein